ncbi:MAG: cell division protein FtsQ/DivIB [Solirubrobacteraceae bacterium]
MAVAFAGGGFLLVRDSSAFAVRDVRMTGVTGPAAPRMAAALEAAAAQMTTLHVDREALRRSVATFPQVRDVRVSADGRTGLRVEVVSYRPVGAVSVAGRRIPVAADGTLLRGLAPARDLATVPVEGGAAGRKLTSPAGLRAVAVLDAAPPALRARIGRVTGGARGLGVSLRQGPDVYFGTRARLTAKWAAAAGVLADPDSRGARYLDVRVPERPAAGGLPPEPEPVLMPDAPPQPEESSQPGSASGGG